jgi:putative hydrolase
LGSDAHICFDIANYEYALPLLQETDFPEELVLNDKPEMFFKYLNIPEDKTYLKIIR